MHFYLQRTLRILCILKTFSRVLCSQIPTNTYPCRSKEGKSMPASSLRWWLPSAQADFPVSTRWRIIACPLTAFPCESSYQFFRVKIIVSWKTDDFSGAGLVGDLNRVCGCRHCGWCSEPVTTAGGSSAAASLSRLKQTRREMNSSFSALFVPSLCGCYRTQSEPVKARLALPDFYN